MSVQDGRRLYEARRRRARTDGEDKHPLHPRPDLATVRDRQRLERQARDEGLAPDHYSQP